MAEISNTKLTPRARVRIRARNEREEGKEKETTLLKALKIKNLKLD